LAADDTGGVKGPTTEEGRVEMGWFSRTCGRVGDSQFGGAEDCIDDGVITVDIVDSVS
jgi:hypothetical protein